MVSQWIWSPDLVQEFLELGYSMKSVKTVRSGVLLSLVGLRWRRGCTWHLWSFHKITRYKNPAITFSFLFSRTFSPSEGLTLAGCPEWKTSHWQKHLCTSCLQMLGETNSNSIVLHDKPDHSANCVNCNGKAPKRLKESPGDVLWDMRVCWDIGTGSPGAAGWMRLCITIMDRAGGLLKWGEGLCVCQG